MKKMREGNVGMGGGGVREWGEERMWLEEKESFASGSIMMLERLKGKTGYT